MIEKIKRKWQSLLKRWRYNSIAHQRVHWREALASQDWQSSKIYGNEWGDPDNPADRLGDYLAIKQRLVSLAGPEKVMLEIGSLAGKWIQFLTSCRKLICVDINDLGFEYIKRRLPHAPVEFYLTAGDELSGIGSGSVDVVFSMDTLVRVPRKSIERYLKESFRVLKEGGCIFLHLPCTSKADSVRRGFVDLSLKEIERWSIGSGFKRISIDTQVIQHGVILQAYK